MSPCTRHLFQALHIFKYLDIHKDNDPAFHPIYHHMESYHKIKSKIQGMIDIYVDSEEYVSIK